MKTLRILSFLAAMLVVAVTAQARQQTILKLKDGSAIYGNVIVQRPGVDITIAADSATFVIADKNLRSSSTKKVKYEDLSRDWKRWVLEKKALEGTANGRYLTLYDISTGSYKSSNVVKLESPRDGYNKYYNVEPCTYKFQWKDLAEIVRSVPSAPDDMYIDDRVTTWKGKIYQGTIVSQVIGKQLAIKTQNGTVTIPMSEVLETQRVPHRKSAKIGRIADYTNTLVINDNKTESGIILTQHYGKKANDKYVTLLLPNGQTRKIQSDSITEYRTSYKGNDRVLYRPDRVYVNEFAINKAKTRIEGNKVLYVDKTVYPFPEGIVITFKAPGEKMLNGWHLIALEPMSIGNGGTTQGYTPEIKENCSIKPSSSDIVDTVSSISFNYLSPGYYALVNPTTDESYIIKITK